MEVKLVPGGDVIGIECAAFIRKKTFNKIKAYPEKMKSLEKDLKVSTIVVNDGENLKLRVGYNVKDATLAGKAIDSIKDATRQILSAIQSWPEQEQIKQEDKDCGITAKEAIYRLRMILKTAIGRCIFVEERLQEIEEGLEDENE